MCVWVSVGIHRIVSINSSPVSMRLFCYVNPHGDFDIILLIAKLAGRQQYSLIITQRTEERCMGMTCVSRCVVFADKS